MSSQVFSVNRDDSGMIYQSPQQARYIPYPSEAHTVTRGRYITSNDARGYVPVYEYSVNNQWLMMDMDDGYILWTSICKALGKTKAELVKMFEQQPDLIPRLRKVKGGFLKIQGTWIPHEAAVSMARKIAWPIKEDLVPFFGPSFPDTCLSPSDPGYGYITPPKRKVRRPSAAVAINQSAQSHSYRRGSESQQSTLDLSPQATSPYAEPTNVELGAGSPISPLEGQASSNSEHGTSSYTNSPHIPAQSQYQQSPSLHTHHYVPQYPNPQPSSQQYHSPSPNPPSPRHVGYQHESRQSSGASQIQYGGLPSYGYHHHPYGSHPSQYNTSAQLSSSPGVVTNAPQETLEQNIPLQYQSSYGSGQSSSFPPSSFHPQQPTEQQEPISHYNDYGNQYRSPVVMERSYGYSPSPQNHSSQYYQSTHSQFQPSSPPHHQPYASYGLSGPHESHVRYSAAEQRGVGGEGQGEGNPYTRNDRHEEYSYPSFPPQSSQGPHLDHQQQQRALYIGSPSQLGYRNVEGTEVEHAGNRTSGHHSNQSPSPFSPQSPYGQ